MSAKNKVRDIVIVTGKGKYTNGIRYVSAQNDTLSYIDFHIEDFKTPFDYDCCAHGDILEIERSERQENGCKCITIKFIRNISHQERIDNFNKMYKERLSKLNQNINSGFAR